jgi:mannose-6-phosphate isomerase class I
LDLHHGEDLKISDLISSNPEKFFGPGYNDKYPFAGDNLVFLLKILSVDMALSI